MDWLPIESAPQMKGVLLWADTSTDTLNNWRMGSGYFATSCNKWIWEGETVNSDWCNPPTHWMPLPPPPEQNK